MVPYRPTVPGSSGFSPRLCPVSTGRNRRSFGQQPPVLSPTYTPIIWPANLAANLRRWTLPRADGPRGIPTYRLSWLPRRHIGRQTHRIAIRGEGRRRPRHRRPLCSLRIMVEVQGKWSKKSPFGLALLCYRQLRGKDIRTLCPKRPQPPGQPPRFAAALFCLGPCWRLLHSSLSAASSALSLATSSLIRCPPLRPMAWKCSWSYVAVSASPPILSIRS